MALCAGSIAAVMLALLALARAIALGVEIWQGGPIGGPEVMALPPVGYWACGLLIAAAAATAWTARSTTAKSKAPTESVTISSDTTVGAPPLSPEGAEGWGTEEGRRTEGGRRRMGQALAGATSSPRLFSYGPETALFVLSVLTGTWAALRVAPFPDTIVETGDRGPVFICWMSAVAVALCGFIMAEWLLVRRRRYHLLWENPSELARPPAGWAGLDSACAVAGWLLILLIGVHFAWPARIAWFSGGGGYRASAMLTALVSLGSSAAMFALASRQRRVASADVAAGLLTLGLCAVALCFVPTRPLELAARFPSHLNAILIGAAVMTGAWVWLAGVWEQQLDNGRAWTMTGRLHGFAPRYALAAGLLGLFGAAMMGLWPGLPGMATRDASFGRMAAGIVGHLLLMLALMVAARRWRRPVFSILGGGAAVSLIVFLVMRLADFVRVVR
jgi:hypothetical protein